ncbi:helix-turn-helix domain-containing protein [Mesobacterium sp. TK19101]|uniref:Helix-turn-helix domain-containing protein n=2 Tax=Mesobacterium hydrothermale TaxID=3111907 RepID=A0ABU6HDM1_9RHOB|nr:helix-turn-helix domain-containing protein [Mesobacterium sp. TK19101]
MPPRPAFLSKPMAAATSGAPAPVSGGVRLVPLAQLTASNSWRLSLQHDRPENLLVWFTRGQGRVTVNGVRRGIGAHNAIYLPARTLIAIEPGPQSLAQVLISPTGLTGQLPHRPVHLRVRESLAQGELTAELDAIQRELREDRPYMAAALQARIGLVAVWLHRQVEAGSSDAPRETAAHRLVKRFAARVVAQYNTDQTMAEHAEALNVTPTHLTRVCREACGLTAADILTQRRLYEARLRLAQPRPAIQDIASDLGFTSAAYFTRFVQQHTGMTPSALRAQGAQVR